MSHLRRQLVVNEASIYHNKLLHFGHSQITEIAIEIEDCSLEYVALLMFFCTRSYWNVKVTVKWKTVMNQTYNEAS